ncbi:MULTISPECIES: hypothetical protein [Clostridium]|mgnify:CR=1 FL=1|uniref:hypothetical protein n=1 Tax=Clostridium TaxID=1485 RepID=UPI0024B35700|nr:MULTISPECIES: hypothetical protein [Clostridium]MBS4839910.1 hypothetical protein [Clostridium sp.]MDI9208863.1 hypothetical protein [Clostridium butyricum]MDU1401070.1 hypothetical protein [Clostridium sp.]MDU1602975.1 hypothetical protein [Clostridium sp.]MDU2895813.1 hypothetical protein [Clostridium sp.]
MGRELFDPEIEKKGIEKGIEIKAKKSVENLLRLGVNEDIVAQGVGLSIEEVREIQNNYFYPLQD